MIFVLTNLLAIVFAWCVGHLTGSRTDPLQRMLISLISFAVLAVLTLQLLGSIGHLTAPGLAAVVAAVTAIVAAMARRRGRAFGQPPRSAGQSEERWDSPRMLVPVVLFTGITGAAVLRACFAGTEFLWDDLTYHATSVGHWISDQRFSVTPWNAQAYYPRNAELIGLWFVLPLGADAYASLAGLYWLLVLAVSVLLLCRRLDMQWPEMLLAGSLCVAAFKTSGYANSFSAVDVAMYAALLAAVALSMPREGLRLDSLGRSEALLSGAATGLALGTKILVAPGAALMLLWWCMVGWRAPAQRRMSLVIYFTIAVLALGTFWYARTAGLTGNPLFPTEIGPFRGLPRLAQKRLLDAVAADPFDVRIHLAVVRALAIVGFAPVFVAAMGYLLAARRSFAHGLPTGSDAVLVARFLLVLGVTYILLYPVMPNSGFAGRGLFVLHLRYVAALVVPAGVVLFFWGAGRFENARPFVLAFGVLATAVAWRGSAEDVVSALVLGSAALLVVRYADGLRRACVWLSRPISALGLSVAFLVGLVAWFPYKQRLTNEVLFDVDYVRPLSNAWRAIEEHAPAGSRIAWFGPRAFIYYPLFGRDYRLSPVRVRNDGNEALPFYEELQQVPLASYYHDRLAVDRSKFVPNLIASGIEYVLVTRLDRPEMTETWRDQLEALRSSDQANLVFEDGQSWVWRLDERP